MPPSGDPAPLALSPLGRELLDDPDADPAAVGESLRHVARANRWFGGARAVHWALGIPGIHLNTVGDLALLPKVLDAAARFERRPADDTMAAIAQSQRMTSLFGLPT